MQNSGANSAAGVHVDPGQLSKFLSNCLQAFAMTANLSAQGAR
jgi:hypothetical protein